MISKLHYFNPGHETAVLLGKTNYTPPANIQRMTQELSYLPVWYADPEDYVFTEDIYAPHFLSLLPKELHPFATLISRKELSDPKVSKPNMQAAPWGLSPHSRRLFQDLKDSCYPNISIPEWKEEYARLTGRQAAAECLNKIREELPEIEIPVAPKFCTKIQEIEKYLMLQSAPFVVKTPYSSSGRGLLWLSEHKLMPQDRSWIECRLKRQGAISIEPALEKKQDFALEFYADGKGGVSYEGLSVFGANAKGAYSGNVLGSQEYLSGYFIDNFGKEKFEQLIEGTRKAVASIYGNQYSGYLGVDMLTYRKTDNTLAIHPCIEVNMRYTMGMVAKQISDKYLTTTARGDFYITFENKPGEAYEKHSFMKEAYPLSFTDGKIKEGYLSLCPVTKDTKYRAYILVC